MTEQEIRDELRLLREKLHDLYTEINAHEEARNRLSTDVEALAREIHRLTGGAV